MQDLMEEKQYRVKFLSFLDIRFVRMQMVLK